MVFMGDEVMNWKKECLSALEEEKLFENPAHKNRFKELLDCFGEQPFFTRGLCKCIYLSAWDEEHFAIMLETLTAMSLGREPDTGDMRIKGDVLAEEHQDAEYYVYQLSNAFLDDAPYYLSPEVKLDPLHQHIIHQALLAAEVIDNL